MKKQGFFSIEPLIALGLLGFGISVFNRGIYYRLNTVAKQSQLLELTRDCLCVLSRKSLEFDKADQSSFKEEDLNSSVSIKKMGQFAFGESSSKADDNKPKLFWYEVYATDNHDCKIMCLKPEPFHEQKK